MSAVLSQVHVQAALREARLHGWKGSVHAHPEAAGFVCVLTSPDYDPAAQSGRMVTARGADAFAALRGAVAVTTPEDGQVVTTRGGVQ